MSDLTSFLLARIAEDEAEAPHVTYQVNRYPEEAVGIRDRVLAECEAKRQILAAYGEHLWLDPGDRDACDAASSAEPAVTMLRLLALPYADHPDYREEWRP